MTGGKFRFVILIALLAAANVSRAGDPARVNAPLAIFDSYCLSAVPDFATIDRRATEARFQMFLERNTPMPQGQSLHQKNWLVALPTGTISLSITDAMNGPLHTATCGIAVGDIEATDVEAALSADARFGAPFDRTPDKSGKGMLVTWPANIGAEKPIEDSQILLARDLPGQPSVILSFIFRTRSGR
jgi:hypothetical protein